MTSILYLEANKNVVIFTILTNPMALRMYFRKTRIIITFSTPVFAVYTLVGIYLFANEHLWFNIRHSLSLWGRCLSWPKPNECSSS